jgi:hypothetical protein
LRAITTSIGTVRPVVSRRHAGFTVEEIRDGPDRPGREFVFIAFREREPRTRSG